MIVFSCFLCFIRWRVHYERTGCIDNIYSIYKNVVFSEARNFHEIGGESKPLCIFC